MQQIEYMQIRGRRRRVGLDRVRASCVDVKMKKRKKKAKPIENGLLWLDWAVDSRLA